MVDEEGLALGAAGADEVGAGRGGHVHHAAALGQKQGQEGLAYSLNAEGIHLQDLLEIRARRADPGIVHHAPQRLGRRRHLARSGRDRGVAGNVDLDHRDPPSPLRVVLQEPRPGGVATCTVAGPEQDMSVWLLRQDGLHDGEPNAFVRTSHQNASCHDSLLGLGSTPHAFVRAAR